MRPGAGSPSQKWWRCERRGGFRLTEVDADLLEGAGLAVEPSLGDLVLSKVATNSVIGGLAAGVGGEIGVAGRGAD
mgnify:CR=1 FL=1